jgi:hypothetical protein
MGGNVLCSLQIWAYLEVEAREVLAPLTGVLIVFLAVNLVCQNKTWCEITKKRLETP